MAKILFARSLPLERDSRSTKMVGEYRERGHRVTSIIWTRGEGGTQNADAVICTAAGGYGKRWGGLGARLKWMWFLAKWMTENRHAYDIVHVVDLDTGVVGVPLARMFGKPVIYDAFDHIGAIAGNGLIGKLLARVERCAIAQAYIAIFPDLIRLEQYGISANERIKILGNIPDLRGLPAPVTSDARHRSLRLVYMGTLEAVHRGLEYLPAICAEFDGRIEVVVGGTGELDGYFLDAAARLPNLTYLGHQDYQSALEMMASADCIYGPYLLSASAHRYASPNKQYEHLALGKPLITNRGTPPGDLVARLQSGFLFDGTIDHLRYLLEDIDHAACISAGQRAAAAWRAEFVGLREVQLERFFERFDRLSALTA